MSVRLYGEELRTSLAIAQPMVCNRDQTLHGVRLHLIRIGSVSGSVFVGFYNDSGTLLKTSSSRLISTIGTPPGDCFQFVPFDLDVICAAGERYWVKLGCSSYTFSESAHVAWVYEYEFGANKYCTRTIFGPNDAPLDVEMWETKLITKGTYP